MTQQKPFQAVGKLVTSLFARIHKQTPTKKRQEVTAETMTILEMSKASGVTARTLRFYEAKELLFPIRVGQRRLYTKRDQARMKLIVQGKRFGFSLEEIRQLLKLYDEDSNGTKQMNETYRIATVRLEQLCRAGINWNR